MACEDCRCRQCMEARGECVDCALKDEVIKVLKEQIEKLQNQQATIVTITEPCYKRHADEWVGPTIPPYEPSPWPPHGPYLVQCTCGLSLCRCHSG